MAPGTWTDAEDRRLLLAIINVGGAGTPNWDEVAARMPGKSKEAVRQRFQKALKKEPVAPESDADPSPAKVTPSRKRGAKGASTGAKRKGDGKRSNPTADETDDDDTASKPAAKKRATNKSKAAAKMEKTGGNDDQDAEAAVQEELMGSDAEEGAEAVDESVDMV